MEQHQEDLRQFTAILAATRQLIDIGAIKVSIFLTGDVKLRFNLEDVKPVVATSNIDLEHFEKVVRNEVEDMMTAVLAGRRSMYMRAVIENEKKKVEAAKPLDEEALKTSISEQIDLVEKQLITPQMKQVLAIKKTSKTNVFNKLSWEVNEKHFDNAVSQAIRTVYATLRLDLHRSSSYERMPIFSPIFGPEEVTTVFDVSLDDIRELQETLAEVAKRIEECEKEKRG
ncbi:MAG: hypothetical protein FJ004_06270 [Chloroflexi bacterium]|nr:hypothetical protein [Chloroflexota bacterium]